MALGDFVMIRFGRNSGKIDMMLEGKSLGMLKMWIINNLKAKTKDIIVFSKDTGEVVDYWEGTGDFPKNIKEARGNIEEYCPGLLADIQKGE